MQELAYSLKPVITLLTFLILLILVFGVFYITRTIFKISRIVDRIEMMSDIKGWLNFAKFFRRKNRKKDND